MVQTLYVMPYTFHLLQPLSFSSLQMRKTRFKENLESSPKLCYCQDANSRLFNSKDCALSSLWDSACPRILTTEPLTGHRFPPLSWKTSPMYNEAVTCSCWPPMDASVVGESFIGKKICTKPQSISPLQIIY